MQQSTPFGGPSALATPNVSAARTSFDDHIDAKIFGLQVDAVVNGKWSEATAVAQKFCTTHGGATDLASTLPAFVRKADQGAKNAKRGTLAAAVLDTKAAFAVAMCMLARATHLEQRVIEKRVATWREELAEAHRTVCVALKAFSDVTTAVSNHTAVAADKAPIFAMLPPMMTRLRTLTTRCVAAGVAVDAGAATGSLKNFFRDLQRSASGSLLEPDTPRAIAVAAARVNAELASTEGVAQANKPLDFTKWFNETVGGEPETKVILNYRVGEAALRALMAPVAVELLSEALVACASADNDCRLAIVESLVAAKMLLGEVPEPELFEHYPMPELEDVAIALRAANLAMFERSVAANSKWLLARGLLLPVTEVRSQVLLQMLVRFYVEKGGKVQIDGEELRAFYAGQFDAGFDVALSLMAPLLLRGAVVGYLQQGTLVVSRKNPFPGLLPERLAASVSASPCMAPPDTPEGAAFPFTAGRPAVN